jgi:23S rRNA (guanosine2251-2'-O)-methyltransferase
MKQSKVYAYGRHAVIEALTHTHAVRKIFLAKGFDDRQLLELARQSNVPTAPLVLGKSEGVGKDTAHQGVVAQVSLEALTRPYKEFMQELSPSPDTLLVILDEIQDPHNVGAIIRSAAAFGAAAVLMPRHNQAPISGAVIKVSAGMAFRVPLIELDNVNRAVRDLKEKGFWIYGLDETAQHALAEEAFDAPSVLILGNEGNGIRQKTRELCDRLLSIPMHPRAESLNVAASAAVSLYAWSGRHAPALAREVS